jgi:titin
MSGLVSPITITGLTNDMSYNISMFAVNSAGTSLRSLPVFTRPVYSIPSTPIVSTISTTVTSATITFTPSLPNGAAITTYKYSLDGGETYIDLARVQKPPLSIMGLTTKTTYSFMLKSVNEVGESLPSILKTFTTK